MPPPASIESPLSLTLTNVTYLISRGFDDARQLRSPPPFYFRAPMFPSLISLAGYDELFSADIFAFAVDYVGSSRLPFLR